MQDRLLPWLPQWRHSSGTASLPQGCRAPLRCCPDLTRELSASPHRHSTVLFPTRFILESFQPLLMVQWGVGLIESSLLTLNSLCPFHLLTLVPELQELLSPHLLCLAPLFSAPWSPPALPQYPLAQGSLSHLLLTHAPEQNGAALPVGALQQLAQPRSAH